MRHLVAGAVLACAPMGVSLLLPGAAPLALAAAGCGGPECVADVPASCSPLYTPTFDQIYTRTLAPTCALSGAACHAPEGAQGGLVFAGADASYAMLLGEADGKA